MALEEPKTIKEQPSCYTNFRNISQPIALTICAVVGLPRANNYAKNITAFEILANDEMRETLKSFNFCGRSRFISSRENVAYIELRPNYKSGIHEENCNAFSMMFAEIFRFSFCGKR